LNVHPGYAKGKMKNSLAVAMELDGMLPAFEVPQFTQDYEGFYHLNEMHGNVSETVMQYIIRDHDSAKFRSKKDLLLKTAAYLNQKYGENTVDVELKDQYFNMREKIEPVFGIVELAKVQLKRSVLCPKRFLSEAALTDPGCLIWDCPAQISSGVGIIFTAVMNLSL
jgi:tripeptide aminopeptidase